MKRTKKKTRRSPKALLARLAGWYRPIVAAAAILGLWVLGPIGLRHMKIFQVQRIEVVGGTYLTAADFARALKLGPNINIFDDLGPLEKQAENLPGVREAKIRRRIPGALVIEVTEVEPVGFVRRDGELVLVDRRAKALPFDPRRAPTDLPILDADSAVAGIIERAKDADQDFYRSIVRGSRIGNTVHLLTASQRFVFRVGATAKQVENAAVVAGEVSKRGLAIREFDARFEGRVIVRGGA